MQPKQWQQHRNAILQHVSGHLYNSLLSRTITYDEFKLLQEVLSIKLSWFNLLGYKQISLFDDPLFEIVKNENDE